MDEIKNQNASTTPQAPGAPVTPPAPSDPTTPTQPPAPTSNPESPAPKKSSNKMLLIVIGAFAILIVLAIVFIVLGRNIYTPQDTTTVPVATEPTATPIIIPTSTPSAESVDTQDVGDPTQDLNTLDQSVNQL